MKIKKRRYPRAEVTWVDSTGSTGWRFEESYATEKCVLIRSCGYLTEKTNEHIALAQSCDDMGKMNDVIKIPKGCVRSIYLIDKHAVHR